MNFFTGLPGQILGALSGAGSFLIDVGKDVIQGLMDGINAVASGIADAVLGPISDAVKGVKDFLGIASPSKLFREIGGFTAQGWPSQGWPSDFETAPTLSWMRRNR